MYFITINYSLRVQTLGFRYVCRKISVFGWQEDRHVADSRIDVLVHYILHRSEANRLFRNRSDKEKVNWIFTKVQTKRSEG